MKKIFTDLAELSKRIQDDRWWRESEREYSDMASLKVVLLGVHGDPLHLGHLQYFRESRKLGNRFLAVVNSTASTIRKKGYSLLPDIDRAELISEFGWIDYILIWDGGTLEEVIEAVKPEIFSRGGDRSDLEQMCPAEVASCRKVKCRLVMGVGGADKVRSSSALVAAAASAMGWTPPSKAISG